MEKWMVVLVAAGFLIPYGTVLAVTGNIHGAEYVRQQEKKAAGKIQDPSGPGGKWRLPVVGRIPAIGTGSSDLAGQ